MRLQEYAIWQAPCNLLFISLSLFTNSLYMSVKSEFLVNMYS